MNVKLYYDSLPLPLSAIKLNGEYLERTLPGYRTSAVSGRESLSASITQKQMGITDGSKYLYKRDNVKELTISFAIAAESLVKYYDSVDKFNKIISKEEMKWIFRDEIDMYYIGTIQESSISLANSAGMSGLYVGVGSMSLVVSSARKYSVEEKSMDATLDNGYTFGVDYQGNRDYHPKFEITMNSDNGYIALMNQNGKILEFGNVDEVDGTTKQHNETLVTISNFLKAADDTSGKDYLHPTYGVKGTLTTATWFGKTFLKLGTAGDRIGTANGGQRTITIPADSSGAKGAKNFYSYMKLVFGSTAMGQTGEMVINYLDSNNKVICALCLYKVDGTGNSAHHEFWINGVCYRTFDYYSTSNKSQNPWYWDWGTAEIRKEGSKVTLRYGGNSYSYNNSNITDSVCTKIQISFKEYQGRTGSQYMGYSGINTFQFTKLNANYFVDSPNVFSKDDKVEIDCSTGSVKVNGISKPELGKIANDWESFVLSPGINQIKVACSSWATKPDLKIKYREAYV